MSFEEKLCLSMLERLKRLQETQQLFSARSDVYMNNMKSQTPPLLKSFHPGDFDNSENEYNSASLSINYNSPTQKILEQNYEDELVHTAVTGLESKSLPKDYELQLRHAAGNVNEEKGIEDDFVIADSVAKFPFLRKGQGIARFKTRPIKGFRKRSSLSEKYIPKSKLKLKKPMIRNALLPIDSNVPDCTPSKTARAFEKLEELVERDSFCSKSSQVIELLHEDPSFCSTPISSKTTFEQSFSLTPNGKEKCRKQIIMATSPGRNRSALNVEAHALIRNQVQNMKLLEFAENAESQNFAANSLSEIRSFSGSGILKKNTPESATNISGSKVKFHDEGVRVLEYDETEAEANISTACSETSDLLSSSDLQNLMLFNYKFNVIHESSFIDNSGPTSKIVVNKEDFALENEKPRGGESYYSAFQTNSPIVSVQPAQPDSLAKPIIQKYLPAKANSIPPFKNNSCVDKNNLELNAHKNLLLSKVDDLKKEIDIFKKRNTCLETLRMELETEKKILLEKQQQSELEKKVSSLAISSKIKKKEKDDKLSKSHNSSMPVKLEELNEKLNKLNTENNNLKRKVINLERKERELRKYNEENTRKMESNNVGLKEKVKTNLSRGFAPRKSSSATPEVVLRQMQRMPSTSKVLEKKFISNIPRNQGNNNLEREGTSHDKTEQNKDIVFVPNEPERFAIENVSNRNFISPDFAVTSSNDTKSMQNPHNLFTIHETDEDVTKCDTDHSLASAVAAKTTHDDNVPKRKYGEKFGNSIQKIMKKSADKIEITDIHSHISTESISNVSPRTRVITFDNGDQKTTCEDKEIYYYAKDNVVHTVYKDDGREEIEFANGQKEIYFKDGSYQIIFPDSSSKSVYKDGSEVCVWKDGTVIKISKSGLKSVHFPNGQREVHEDNAVRRIYPDGTVKILYRDGRQETRYSNGRVRIKDKDGNVFVTKR